MFIAKSIPKSIPTNSANFSQIPAALLDAMVRRDLTREELVVCLRMSERAYAVGQSEPLQSMASIVAGTGLSTEVVDAAVTVLIRHGLLIRFDILGSSPPMAMFALRTEENVALGACRA